MAKRKRDASCACCRAVECGICGLEFNNEHELHDRLFSQFGIEDDLRTFTPSSHTDDLSNSTCPYCDMSFHSPKGLNQHIGKMHNTSAKSASCPQCGKRFKTKYAVKFHVTQVHEGGTKVRCPLCPKLLYNKYMLKTHLRDAHGAS
jgi:uncharacterized C2H2 Zn-finger protein